MILSFCFIIKLYCKFWKVIFHAHSLFVNSCYFLIQTRQVSQNNCDDVRLNGPCDFLRGISRVGWDGINFGFGRVNWDWISVEWILGDGVLGDGGIGRVSAEASVVGVGHFLEQIWIDR